MSSLIVEARRLCCANDNSREQLEIKINELCNALERANAEIKWLKERRRKMIAEIRHVSRQQINKASSKEALLIQPILNKISRLSVYRVQLPTAQPESENSHG